MRSLRLALLPALLASACGSDPVQSLDAAANDAAPTSGDAGGGGEDGGESGRDASMPGEATLSESSIDFGRVISGTTKRRTLTVDNTSSEPATVTLSMPSGRDAARFSRTIMASETDGRFQVPARGSVTVELAVTSTGTGPLAASIAADLCGGACPAAITLLAEGALSGVECDAMLSFGTLNPGTCRTLEAHCTNTGNAVEQLDGVTLDPASDAAYRLDTASVATTLMTMETVAIPVELCAAMGGHSGTVVVASSNPTPSQHRIALSGRGGGGDITCAPAAIDFGSIAVGGTASRTLRCTNRGPELLTITAVSSSDPAFAPGTASAPVAPGASVDIEIIASGAAVGALSGTLTVSSDDPDSPQLSVPMSGSVVNLLPCEVTVAPEALDFGVVAPADRRTAPVVVINEGRGECIIDAGTLAGSSAFAANVPAMRSLAAGESLSVPVTFTAPTMAGTASASLSLAFVNPQSPPIEVALAGRAGATRLVIEPAVIDFGAAPAGCAAPFERTVVVRSLAATPLTLTQLALGGTSTAAFTLAGVPGNRTLAPFASVTLTISFAPAAPGAYAAQLQVGVTGQAGLTIAPISGRGDSGAARTDTFRAGAPQLDLLFVSDDSASMAAAQAALAATAPAIAASLTARGVDFHIGVVTTDMVDAARSGRLQGAPTVLDASTPDLEAAIAEHLAVGTDGDGAAEQGITAARAAVTAPLATTDNVGFLRPGADLAVVILSDEDDHGPLTDLAAVIADLRAASGTGRAQVSAIVGPASGGCGGAAGNAAAAPRYNELAVRSDDGLTLSFCDPMPGNVAQVMAHVLGEQRYPLSATPLVSTVQVSVNGAVVPERDAQGARQWWYDATANAVLLLTPPAAGAAVAVAYEQYCLSATCGNGTMDAREQCDDGNRDDTDACITGCVLARCGDGLAQAGAEGCDDANLVDTDACLSTCAAAACGDGAVRAGVEDCDDGNTTGGDACPADCNLRLDLSEWYAITGPSLIPYAPLQAPTNIAFADLDDGSASVTLPFTFTYFGVATSSLAVSPNGLVAFAGLGAAGAFSNASFPVADAPNGVLAVWWEDLLIDPAVNGGASVRYQTLGAAPARSFVIEWQGVRVAGHSTNNNRRFNMQLALFEGTGVIEYRYGETQTSGNPPTATSASVGMEDAAGAVGGALLPCTPNCAGPARPQNPNGFPRQTMLRATPL